MPTYEYRCENGHDFEEFQSIIAAPVDMCPVCGGKSARKISGGTGLIFKGSGFYITDYARGGSKSTTDNTKHDAVPANAKTPTTTDNTAAKPAAGSTES